MVEKLTAGPKNTMAELKGIKILVHGRFYYKTETSKGTKEFKLVVRAKSMEMFRETSQKYLGTDDNGQPKFRTNSYLNIRGQLKKRLLPILLQRQFPEFARVRYVVIDEIISETGEKLDLPIHFRSRAQLEQLIADEKIPIDSSEYLEIDDLRADIISYLTEPEIFLENKPKKDRKRQEERDFIAMNDLGGETLPPVVERRSVVPATPAPAIVPAAGGILDD